jgi:protein-disulfide isomerase
VIYWHVAFLGQESQWAAEASECAADQNAFWEYHDLLFEKQSGENQGIYTVENLKSYAVELNLDTQTFNECFDSGKHTTTVNTDTQIAQQIGATSTPAFVINGQPLLGAQPFDVFQQYIETALASPDN